jgi:hypothetical protein
VNEDYLTPEDRRWLRDHGWAPPPLRPRWDEDAEEMVAACPDCGARLAFAYDEVFVFSQVEPVKRIPTHVDLVTRSHARKCEARS